MIRLDPERTKFVILDRAKLFSTQEFVIMVAALVRLGLDTSLQVVGPVGKLPADCKINEYVSTAALTFDFGAIRRTLDAMLNQMETSHPWQSDGLSLHTAL